MLSQLIHPYRRVEETTANPPTMADYFPPQPDDGGATNFQPSLTVVLGVLAVMFSLTFALLLYAKCCQRDSHAPPPPGRRRLRSSIFSSPSEAAAAGLTKQAIESLPLIGFGSLGGSKEGLECAVCLSRYQDADILRLLPKCSHAFHVHCVDQWLESNSTCPLCRSQVAADDASLILSTSSRFVQSAQDSNDSNEGVDLLVEREEEEEGDLDASIFSIRSSFRKLFVAGAGSARDKALDKHKHKIIISDVVLKNRWSNVSYSDLMSLESEMMLSGDRFSVSGSWNRERSLGCSDCAAVVEGRRSVSEITLFSRLGWRKGRECPLTGAGEEEDKKRKIWLPIARKTVEWFASREKTQHSRYIIDDTV